MDLPAFFIILSSDIIKKMRKINKKTIILSLAAVLLVFYIFNFSLNNPVFVSAQDAAVDEGKVDDAKDDIKDLEKELKKAENDYGKLSQQYQQILRLLETAQREINKTNSLIIDVKEEMSRKEKEIELLGKRIAVDREIMKKILQQIYFNKKSFFSNLASEEGKYSRLEGNSEYLVNFEDKLGAIMEDIGRSKQKISKEKENLEEDKDKHENLLTVKKTQQQDLIEDKLVTQSEIIKKDVVISKLNSKLSKLKSELSSLLGKSYNAENIKEAIKFASKKTGVRKEFLMAMLDKESDLGRFTGGCFYSKNPKVKRMKEADKDVFKTIMKELGYELNDKKLSCWPGYGYGGAMGVAQFMPTTWINYKNSITSYTGHNPPDPWNLTDGVVGMAEKLRRAGAASEKKEHYAAKVYYCGGPASPYWNNKCEAYADTVISWSNGYDDF